jgi:hypothetical protein
LKIKISLSGELHEPDLDQFLPPLERLGFEFFINEQVESADVWFVIEGTLPWDNSCIVPKNKVFFLGAETARSIGFFYETPGWQSYLGQFHGIYAPQELMWDNAFLSYPFLPWMINSNHGPRMFSKSERDINFFRSKVSIEKTKLISVFCSKQGMTAEHRARFRFTEGLKSHFKDRLDWFGNGVNSVPQKWDGLAQYKYSVVLENQATSKVITEKIQDAFLALTMPIYWGAPEAPELFGKDSLYVIDVRDLRGSISKIEEVLETDPYDSHLPSLIAARTVVTEELNFLKRMLQIYTSHQSVIPDAPSMHVVKPLSYFTPGKNLLDRTLGPVSTAISWISQTFVRK